MNLKKFISGLATVVLGKNLNLILYTKHGDIPKDFIKLFNFKNGEEILLNSNYRSNHKKYVDRCGKKEENMDNNDLSHIKKNLSMNNFSQNELCNILDEACQRINHNYHPIKSKSKNIHTEMTTTIKTTSRKTTTLVKKITSTKKGNSKIITSVRKITTIKKTTKINTKKTTALRK